MYWWRPSYFWGGVLVVAGVLALLANLHLLDNLDWNYVWPVVLIALGVWLLAVRVLPGDIGGPLAGAPLDRSEARNGLAKARLDIGLGSVRVDMRGAAIGDQLYHARIDYHGRPPDVELDRATGTVRISHPGSWMMGGWGRVKLDMQLSDAIPWEVELKTGTARGTIDLSTAKLARFESDSGSSKIDISVPQPVGEVPIRVEGGSVGVRLRRPPGASVHINASGGSVRLVADGVRQRGFGNVTWHSGADSAGDRYEARFSGGSVAVDVEQG